MKLKRVKGMAIDLIVASHFSRFLLLTFRLRNLNEPTFLKFCFTISLPQLHKTLKYG